MKQKHQRIVAFALETNDEESNAQKKRKKKNADFIVLNSTRNPGTTFRTDDNQITIISEEGRKNMRRNPRQRWLTTLLTSWLICFSGTSASAQELQAKITINHAQIAGTENSVFDNLQQTLEQFVNDRQWTHLQFQKNERIICNFNITVSKYDKDNNLFTCKAIVQANRPVYNSAYTSTLYNNVDDNFTFKFAEFDQLEFNEEQIDNPLTALFAYYAYLIIGLDLDSFAPNGGEDVLQRCMNLTNNAQNLDYPGWKAFATIAIATPSSPTIWTERWPPSASCNTTTIARDWTRWQTMPSEDAPR